MFADAYRIASAFTFPVVMSFLHFDGTVASGLASFIVVNDEGWIITASHVLDINDAYQQHQSDIANYEQQLQAIQAGEGTEKGKRKRIRALNANSKWIRKLSYWWGADTRVLTNVVTLTEADLSLGKLEPFDAASVANYPIFKVGSDMEPGRSLCKLGFPFHEIQTTYDAATDRFVLAPGACPFRAFRLKGS